MKQISVSFPAELESQLVDILKGSSCVDWTLDRAVGRFDKLLHVIVQDGQGQGIIDAMEDVLKSHGDWRITVLPVLSTLPRPDELEPEEAKKSPAKTLQEELYQNVLGGAKLDINFIVLTLLSTIVAALGLNMNNVAVVIGAMVIAPWLGPVLAFSLGSALGDIRLIHRAVKTLAVGLALGFALALLLTVIMPVNGESRELMDRTTFGPELAVLAIASGAAAALSLSTGLSSALVGVMVAVALLPPTVSSALFLGDGQPDKALAAFLLMVLNVVCVLLAAQLVFFWKGARPKNWWAEARVKKSLALSSVILVMLIAGLLGLGWYMAG